MEADGSPPDSHLALPSCDQGTRKGSVQLRVETCIWVSVAHSAPEPEMMSKHLVGFAGLFYQDFSNAFLNL